MGAFRAYGVAALFALSAVNCGSSAAREEIAVEEPEVAPPKDTCTPPLAGHGDHRDGTCEMEVHCAWDEACTGGACTKACSQQSDCRRMVGCLASGVCGRCTTSGECGDDRVCLDGYCMREQMRVWDIVVNPEDWAALLAAPRDRIEYPCSLTAGGKLYEDCIVRARGQSSIDFEKVPLRIEFAEDAKHPGYARKINLRAEYNDRSILRNVVSHELFRRLTHVPTPRTRFVRLSVNGDDRGVYVEYERISKKFLERHRRDREELTYEVDPKTFRLLADGGGGLIPLPEASQYRDVYDLKTGTDDSDTALRALIEDNISPDWEAQEQCRVRGTVHLESYLDYLAVMALITGKDHARKNYYLSRQEDAAGNRKWEIYPWDLDLSLGCFWTWQNGVFCEEQSVDETTYFGTIPEGYSARYPMPAVANALIDVVVRHPALRTELDRRVCEFLRDPFWTTGVLDLIDAYETVLLPEVVTDEWDRNGMRGAPDLVGSEAAFRGDVAAIRAYFAARTEVLVARLGCL